jgi:hypothetical protein
MRNHHEFRVHSEKELEREGIQVVVQVVSSNTFASIDEVFLDNFQELLV